MTGGAKPEASALAETQGTTELTGSQPFGQRALHGPARLACNAAGKNPASTWLLPVRRPWSCHQLVDNLVPKQASLSLLASLAWSIIVSVAYCGCFYDPTRLHFFLGWQFLFSSLLFCILGFLQLNRADLIQPHAGPLRYSNKSPQLSNLTC
jgi:hypothetical protein